MYLNAISFQNFRNIQTPDLLPSSGLNLLVGQNGQGKTNVLEAISFLASAASFRTSKAEHLIAHKSDMETPFSRLEGRFDRLGERHDLEIVISPRSKKILCNNKPTSAAGLRQSFPLILFSPESLSYMKGGPDLRRRLIDQLIVMQRAISSTLPSDFRKVLRTRNRVLKDLQQMANPTQSREVLTAVNESYLEIATQLTLSRLEAIATIESPFQETAQHLLDSPNVDISVDYCISDVSILGKNASEIHNMMQKRMAQLQEAEIAAGLSLVGPHKHEINFLFDSQDSRFFCSQGQQRALIIAFKIAQIMYHDRLHRFYPILMLDDVMSELDQQRREYLLDFLRRSHAQIFLTTTDVDFSHHFDDLEHAVFQVQDGLIEKQI